MGEQRFTDQRHLLTDQYRDAGKLEARVALHARFSTNPLGWTRWVFERLEVPPTGRVLELGCGPGLLWRDQEIPEGWRVTLSDFSPGMLKRARENVAETGRDFDFRLFDAQAIPSGDGSFDTVIANHMLYHVPDRERAIAEIRRVLAPGGRFYAATNGSAHMRQLEQFYRIIDPGRRRMTEPFNLENGVRQLLAHFDTVVLHEYEDGLVITEAEPLVAYILSTLAVTAGESAAGESAAAELAAVVPGEPPPERRVDLLRRAVADRLSESGSIRVSKSTGLFEAAGIR
jgi:SAM-dependent methyltransferase